jgi:hypothetical protein
MGNTLLEQVPRCPACGEPEFRFLHPPQDWDPSWPSGWFLINREPETIAGGIVPASVCTSCGVIAGVDGRAIRWNLEGGSPVPKLVPPVERPFESVYDAAEWDSEFYLEMNELIMLRGRWADDVDLEATALPRLILFSRAEGGVPPELLERALTLLGDERLGWAHRVELHHEVGLSLNESSEAYDQLSAALELATDKASRDAFSARERESFALPHAHELAIDLAEKAQQLGRHEEALRLLKSAGVPWVGDNDEQPGRAAFGKRLAEQQDDLEFLLECELRLAIQAYYDEDGGEFRRSTRRIRELITADDTGHREQLAMTILKRTGYRDAAQAVLNQLRK